MSGSLVLSYATSTKLKQSGATEDGYTYSARNKTRASLTIRVFQTDASERWNAMAFLRSESPASVTCHRKERIKVEHDVYKIDYGTYVYTYTSAYNLIIPLVRPAYFRYTDIFTIYVIYILLSLQPSIYFCTVMSRERSAGLSSRNVLIFGIKCILVYQRVYTPRARLCALRQFACEIRLSNNEGSRLSMRDRVLQDARMLSL